MRAFFLTSSSHVGGVRARVKEPVSTNPLIAALIHFMRADLTKGPSFQCFVD
jgi:hypothetical protein